MKVICVDNSMNESVHKDFKSCPLIEGNVYTVIGTEMAINGFNKYEECFVLKEFYLSDRAFGKERFIPLSEIDETEMVNSKQEIVNN